MVNHVHEYWREWERLGEPQRIKEGYYYYPSQSITALCQCGDRKNLPPEQQVKLTTLIEYREYNNKRGISQ